MIDEIWRPIKDFPDYQVSNLGRVRSSKFGKERILKNSPTVKGYLAVNLYRRGIRHFNLVHVLVLEAFVGPCPFGYQTGHLDNDKRNPRLDNLAWITQSENQRMSDRTFGNKRRANLTLAQVREIRRLYATGEYKQKELAKMYGETFQNIHSIVRGKSWKE
jgi:hypothetical protein